MKSTRSITPGFCHPSTIPNKNRHPKRHPPPLTKTPIDPLPIQHLTMKHEQQQRHHFLIVAFPAQGHINPARQLARRLSLLSDSIVTISTGLSAHRRLYPASDPQTPITDGGPISYFPYSDGYDDRKPSADDRTHFFTRLKRLGSPSLHSLINHLSSRGPRVTCVIYTILLSWAADVARDLSIPTVPFWLQPAAVFAIFHHYFHGHAHLITAHKDNPSFSINLPSLPPLRIRDLPSFLTTTNDLTTSLIAAFREMFEILDRDQNRLVLVNTFDSLEPESISAVREFELLPIGPIVDGAVGGGLFADDSLRAYTEWLDSNAEKSVVYVSFGSIAVPSRRQLEEISIGLEESGRPYLWVVRREAIEKEGVEFEGGEKGMVVEWCSQASVLSHRSIGCFVTHCGWNSTVESIACGVPAVMLPQWADQPTNARLMGSEWGMGVRAEANEEGVVEGSEVRRCLDRAMGDGEIRRKADEWREEAGRALEEGGSSDRNLRYFVDKIGRL